MTTRILTALLSTAALAAAGCGDDGASSSSDGAATQPASAEPSGQPVDTIVIRDFKYVPPVATVKAGSTITFNNEDKAPHTVTAKNADAFDSGDIKGRSKGTVTVDKPGTYQYFCEFHAFMNGTLKVVR